MNCNVDDPIKSVNINFIKDCYLKNADIQIEKIENILNVSSNPKEMCLRIRNRNDPHHKKKYYKHTYDPTKVIENIKSYNIDATIKNSYLKNLDDLIDSTIKKNNCCNCISFTLYSAYVVETRDEYITNFGKKLMSYLYSLKLSAMTIEKNLPEFIARIYLDISVYILLQKIKSDKKLFDSITNLLQFLLDHDNVEIYTMVCDSFKANGVHKTRSLRYSIICEPDVNFKFIREADGYVSNMDCYNINKFVENNNKIMFIYNFIEEQNMLSEKGTYILDNYDKSGKDEIEFQAKIDAIDLTPYSKWLRIYQTMEDYFYEHNSLFDVLAGVFGLSVQIKPTTFQKSIDHITEIINITRGLYEQRIKTYEQRINTLDNSDTTKINLAKGNMEAIFIAADEIFLMHLFRNIISIEKNNKLQTLDNPGKFSLINDVTIGAVDSRLKKINSLEVNNEKIARLNAISFVMSNIEYPRKIYSLSEIMKHDADPFGKFLQGYYNKLYILYELNTEILNAVLKSAVLRIIIIDSFIRNILDKYNISSNKNTLDIMCDNFYFIMCDSKEAVLPLSGGKLFKIGALINYQLSGEDLDDIPFKIYNNEVYSFDNFLNPPEEKQQGGYYEKYLKYKAKYLNIKK